MRGRVTSILVTLVSNVLNTTKGVEVMFLYDDGGDCILAARRNAVTIEGMAFHPSSLVAGREQIITTTLKMSAQY